MASRWAQASLHSSSELSGSALDMDNEEFEFISVTSDSELHNQFNNRQANGARKDSVDPSSTDVNPHLLKTALLIPRGLTGSHSSMVIEAPLLPPEPAPAPGALEHFNTACLSAADVQNFVKRLVDGQPLAGMDDEEADEDPERFHQHLDDQDITTNKNAAEPDVEEDLLRGYKINKPPTMRPVRVYIAGLFDVLHPGIVHNLRQAKYSFPSVHLLVGVFAEPPPHSPSIFTHLERLETVRHIRYIDELIPEAPLHLTQSFLREWNIDYVAYEGGSNTGDADETAANWNDPGFQLARKLGKFLPLRSTRAISTGEVLQRIRAEGTYGGLAREATVTDKPHPLSITTDFAPLTPASYQDDDDDDEGKKTKEVTPEPNELLDPFTN